MIPHDTHLHIGSLLFEGIDQIDLTGLFEVLSRIPNATYRIYGKTAAPVRDLRGLWLTPDATLADAPPLDVPHVPGGFGQEALMEDVEVLAWIGGRRPARAAFSRCAPAPCSAARPACLRDAAQRHTGRRFTCCRSSARSRSTNVWSSTAPGSSPRALRPASTVPCASRPSFAAMRPHRPSSLPWPMRRNRPSTVARQPRYWNKLGDRCEPSRRGVSKRRDMSPPNLGSPFRPWVRTSREHRLLAGTEGLLACPPTVVLLNRIGWGSLEASTTMTPWQHQ
jgi:putative intracellular protease/amidase